MTPDKQEENKDARADRKPKAINEDILVVGDPDDDSALRQTFGMTAEEKDANEEIRQTFGQVPTTVMKP